MPRPSIQCAYCVQSASSPMASQRRKGMSAESGAQLPASCKPRCTVSNGFTRAGLRLAVGYNSAVCLLLCLTFRSLSAMCGQGHQIPGTRWDAVVCVLPGTFGVAFA